MTKIINWYSGLSIYIKLLPFLALYLIVSIFFADDILDGDEKRYFGFAENLTKGFYSPPFPNIKLWAGPGYPLFLAPFVFFNSPLCVLRILNAVLIYFSLIISYQTFTFHSSIKNSLLFTILLGLYFPIYEVLPSIQTESLSWFLISLVCFLFIKNFLTTAISRKYIILAALSIGFLAMTKVIFGYVIVIMLFISIVLFLFPEFRISAKKSFLIFFFSLIFCLPWLFYTYSLTNKLFYWGNSGSMSLYTMSSPYEDELGDWTRHEDLLINPNHHVFMDSVLKLTPIEREEAYQSAAIQNIKKYPKKYFTNWLANTGRLFFSYPYSNSKQTINSYYTIIPNMFIVVLMLFAIGISIVYYKKVPDAILLLLLFMVIYLFGSTLVSAYRRMFYITIPFWFVFFNYIFTHFVSIKIKNDS